MSKFDSKHRPRFHFSPPANWLNDPNGLVYYQGEYHLFYQHNPVSADFGPMHWGHAVSSDMVNWQHLPIALYPDEIGSIFSGSVVIDWDNTTGFGKEAMVAVFTHDQNGYQSQSLAYSTDRGRSWTKYPDNPVIHPPEGMTDFRDPKVFWYGESVSGHWAMALAAGKYIAFYRSTDLIHWEPCGSFGFDHGSQLGVWETPDLFQLPVDGETNMYWVLTVGVGDGGPAGRSGMQYFIGQFDGETFSSENPKDTILWVDHGADYYAAQSWNHEPDGRRLMIGWQSNWQYAQAAPTISWRGSFSLPRELSLKRTKWGIRLFQQPIPEMISLRASRSDWQNLVIVPGKNPLENYAGDSFEIIAKWEINSKVSHFGLRVRVGNGEQTAIGYDVQMKKIYIDRTKSGESSFGDGFAGLHFAGMEPVDGCIHLHIFLDRFSVEVFGNDGQVVLSDCIFPDDSSKGFELFAQGGEVLLKEFVLIELRPANYWKTAIE